MEKHSIHGNDCSRDMSMLGKKGRRKIKGREGCSVGEKEKHYLEVYCILDGLPEDI